MSLATEFPERLITLSTGQPGLRGSIQVDTHEPVSPADAKTEGGAAVLSFVSSDSTLDRYNEIISPTGWHLATYQRNPIFQNAHQYGDVIFTLGKAITTEIRTVADHQVLFQQIQFATDVNPMARIAYGLYKGKFLNAVSVGFIPIRWLNADGTEYNTAHAATASVPARGQAEEVLPIENQKSKIKNSPAPFRRKYLEHELLEVSAVAIPANPNALALAFKSGAIEKSDLKETADLINYTLSPPPIHQSTNPPIHPLLALVREIRDLMKRA